ncbi:MAG: hypothetical protein KAS32_23665 [Candidatus Peribacteraceae bacterium]|nr:hypothetical protein [Candidatus Peribacteraceae bacterium]
MKSQIKLEANEYLKKISKTPSLNDRVAMMVAAPMTIRQLVYMGLYEPDAFSDIEYDLSKIKLSQDGYGINQMTSHTVWPIIFQHLGNRSKLPAVKKNTKAVQILESVNKNEALLLDKIFTGKFNYSKITKALYERAYGKPKIAE